MLLYLKFPGSGPLWWSGRWLLHFTQLELSAWLLPSTFLSDDPSVIFRPFSMQTLACELIFYYLGFKKPPLDSITLLPWNIKGSVWDFYIISCSEQHATYSLFGLRCVLFGAGTNCTLSVSTSFQVLWCLQAYSAKSWTLSLCRPVSQVFTEFCKPL